MEIAEIIEPLSTKPPGSEMRYFFYGIMFLIESKGSSSGRSFTDFLVVDDFDEDLFDTRYLFDIG